MPKTTPYKDGNLFLIYLVLQPYITLGIQLGNTGTQFG